MPRSIVSRHPRRIMPLTGTPPRAARGASARARGTHGRTPCERGGPLEPLRLRHVSEPHSTARSRGQERAADTVCPGERARLLSASPPAVRERPKRNAGKVSSPHGLASNSAGGRSQPQCSRSAAGAFQSQNSTERLGSGPTRAKLPHTHPESETSRTPARTPQTRMVMRKPARVGRIRAYPAPCAPGRSRQWISRVKDTTNKVKTATPSLHPCAPGDARQATSPGAGRT